MWSWSKSRFKVLDAVIIVLVCAVAVSFFVLRAVHGYPNKPVQVAPIGPGSKLTTLEPELKRSRHTLVMAVAVGCPFCEASAPFYRELSGDRAVRNVVRLLAVTPQPTSQARRYLDGLGVHIDGVVQASLGTLGIVGIPTLALADRTGVVSDVWYGELNSSEQQEVLATLGAVEAGRRETIRGTASVGERAPVKVDLAQLRAWRDRGLNFVVVAVQPRASFAVSHLPGAVNIPIDELTVRAPIELSATRATVLDCTGLQYMACYFEARTLGKLGFSRVSILPSHMKP